MNTDYNISRLWFCNASPTTSFLTIALADWNLSVNDDSILHREELSTHNKGKDGYVEKLEFLERADLRFGEWS